MKYSALVSLILLAALIFMAGCTTTTPEKAAVPAPAGSKIITVDALLPLNGSYASFGEQAKASLLTSEADINQYYQDTGSSSRVNVVIHDTGSDPATALELVKKVHADGRRFVLGQMTSAEIAAIKEYTDTNGMVVLDAGSTTSSLAIPGDSLYRLTSDDSAQGRVMGILLGKNNIRAIVPIWRGDIWGEGLLNSTKTAFSSRKGVILDGVRYDPAATDFALSLSSLDILTGDAITRYGADRVGVYIIGLDESASILNEAAGKPNLSRVRWFGCDGNTAIPSLTGSTAAARFAAQTNMTGTVWGIAYGDPSSGPQTRIKERLGYTPSAGPVTLYDALWVVKDVYDEIPADANQARTEAALVRRLSTYDGETKSLLPNAAGDRSLASYDVMLAVGNPDGTGWTRVSQIITWADGREDIETFR
ncbi:ABC transporter substrate-binding protein [Methanoregula sp.]|uniref:ABC transporter substrate-binding protein n=1 Tax=Methanoregula sp. TaxID=2052170 RepID=UPI0035621C93